MLVNIFAPYLIYFRNMEQKSIFFNGVSIPVTVKDGQSFLPIKPICEAIGIDVDAQRNKIKDDEILSSVTAIITATGADGKSYDMVCLPVKFVYGWIFSINPGKVSSAAREMVAKYRRECYEVLYDYFHNTLTRQLDTNAAEIEQLKALNDAIAREKEAKADKAKAEKNLAQIRASRLDEQPALF